MDEQELYLKELNEQGKTLFSCDKYDEAIRTYQKAIEADPMYLPSYFNACEAYIMSDRFDEAKGMMHKAILLNKENGEAYFHLGNIALLEENLEEAKLQYAKAINNGFDIPQIYINLASVAEDNDEWEQAVAYYTKAIARDRTCHPAKIRKIQIYLMTNQYPEAINACDDLIETNPEIFEGHHFKFAALSATKKYNEAQAVLDKAQRLFPDDQGFMLDQVKLLELKGDYTEALNYLETMNSSQVPADVMAIEKARLLVALERTDDALQVLHQCENQANDEIQRLLIVISLERMDFDGIYSSAEAILKNEAYDSNYFSALYYKAYALKMLGKSEAEKAYRDAAGIMQRACSINSGVLDLYVYRAICYRELKDYGKANEMLDYVDAVDENIAETAYIRYLVYSDLGDSRAEAELEKAKRLDPNVAAVIGK